MKSAAVGDEWRAIAKPKESFRLAELRVTGKDPLADLTISMPAGLAVICGLNGVGKSTLLRVIQAVIQGAAAMGGRCRPETLNVGTAQLDMVVDGEVETLNLGVEPSTNRSIVVVDAFAGLAEVMTLSGDTNFSDLIEGQEPYHWEGNDLRSASYLVGRNYRSLRITEFEVPAVGEAETEEVGPYFEVETLQAAYDSFSMGLGELAALHAMWHILRAEPGTLVLLEEPESFLSSRSTVALTDLLVRQINRKNLYGVVSTHSSDVVSRTPLSHVVLLDAAGGDSPSSARTPSTRAELEHSLGAYVGQSRLIIAEDKVAAIFAQELLTARLGIWGESIEIRGASGVASVLGACRLLPRLDTVRLVGVLDGDQRDKPLPTDLKWPIVCLPSSQDPNELLADAARRRTAAMADYLGRSNEQLTAALGVVAGRDPHDWFPELAASLNLDESAVVRSAIRCWLDINGDEEAESFVRDVVAAIADAD